MKKIIKKTIRREKDSSGHVEGGGACNPELFLRGGSPRLDEPRNQSLLASSLPLEPTRPKTDFSMCKKGKKNKKKRELIQPNYFLDAVPFWGGDPDPPENGKTGGAVLL